MPEDFPWPPHPLQPDYRVELIAETTGDSCLSQRAWLHFHDWLKRPVALYAERSHPLGGGNGAAILHCVGGAQTVHRGDLAFWTDAGYAAASFDWQIAGVAGRPADRTSGFPEEIVPQSSATTSLQAALLPVAVQAAAVCLDWVSKADGVDPSRLGVCGISWGGYLAWVLAAWEPRVRALVPAFGCGGLFAPGRAVAKHSPDVASFWIQYWEPANLAARISIPVCYLNGTNDFFGDPLIAENLLAQISSPHVRHYLPNVDHSLDAAQSRLAQAWMKQHLLGGPAVPAPPRLTPCLALETAPGTIVERVEIWWSDHAGPSRFRCWQPTPPPRDRPIVAFARVLYQDGIEICTPIASVDPKHGRGNSPVDISTSSATIPFGLGWRWEVGSTRFFNNEARAIPPSANDVAWTLIPARPATDEPITVLLHPCLRRMKEAGTPRTLRLGWSEQPVSPLAVILELRDEKAPPAHGSAEWDAGSIYLDPARFPDLPPDFTWNQTGRILITSRQVRKSFRVGPWWAD